MVRAILFVTAALFIIAPCRSEPPAASGKGVAADARLQRPLRATVLGRPLAVSLRECARAGEIRLDAAEQPGDQQIVLVSSHTPFGRTLQVVADHFGYTWKPIPDSIPDAPPVGYRLIQSAARAAEPARLRQQNATRTDRILRERMDLYRRAANAGPDVLAQLRAQDTTQGIFLMEHNAYMRAEMRLLALLTPAEMDAVLGGRPFTSAPYSQLPKAVQELVTTAMRSSDPDLRFRIHREVSDGGVYVMFSRVKPDGTTGSGGSLGSGVPVPSRNRGFPVPAQATAPERAPKDPDLLVPVTLQDEQGKELPVSAGLPSLLAAVSRASGLDVLSDCYADSRLQYEPGPLGKRPLWQFLNILAEQYDMEWKRSGTFLLFRNKDWYEEELREIPERRVASWYSAEAPAPPVTLDEFAVVASTLTDPQLEGLRLRFPTGAVYEPYAWLRLVTTLDTGRRASLLRGTEQRASSWSVGQRQRLATLLAVLNRAQPSLRAVNEARFRLTPDPKVASQLVAQLSTGGGTWRYTFTLPRKQPLLPAPRIVLD